MRASSTAIARALLGAPLSAATSREHLLAEHIGIAGALCEGRRVEPPFAPSHNARRSRFRCVP